MPCDLCMSTGGIHHLGPVLEHCSCLIERVYFDVLPLDLRPCHVLERINDSFESWGHGVEHSC